ncbi:MAG: hypothetical protein KAH12_08775 [Anaerolineales bacterium]|nr:hypothetical protein [Anaerolineales bacterium]
MKHQQYENWILMDEELNQEQQRDLHGHLKQCSQCQALYQASHQITHLFKTAPEPAPAVGFSSRWLVQIDRVEKRKNRIILFSTLGAISLATLILLSTIGFELRSVVGNFPQMMYELVTLITNWMVFFNQISDIITPLFRVGAKLLSPVWLYITVFGLSGITAAWTIAFYRSRGMQKEIG